MSQMLYTKYRPKSLKEIQNQDETVKVLESAIETRSLASAYIFTGGRGTGKTSVARAFARDLRIDEADVFELDAASHSKIEDIRELGESVVSLPFYSKYKMYILDEVHMLSKNAANAFLKLLEEPPQHVIFILATTDPQRLPETILSRCIQFNLKKPTLSQIKDFLKKVCEAEGVTLEEELLQALAVLGDGSYRDSLSHLQKIVMIGQGQKLSNEQVFATLNISPLSSVFTVIKGLDNKENDKVKNALQVLSEVQERGLDLNFFFANLLAFSRQLLFVRFGSKTLEQIQKEEGDYVAGEIKDLLSNKTPKLLSPVLSEMLALSEAKSSTSKVLGLEILLVS